VLFAQNIFALNVTYEDVENCPQTDIDDCNANHESKALKIHQILSSYRVCRDSFSPGFPRSIYVEKIRCEKDNLHANHALKITRNGDTVFLHPHNQAHPTTPRITFKRASLARRFASHVRELYRMLDKIRKTFMTHDASHQA